METERFTFHWWHWVALVLLALLVVISGPKAWAAGSVTLGVLAAGAAVSYVRSLPLRIVLGFIAVFLILGPVTWIVMGLAGL